MSLSEGTLKSQLQNIFTVSQTPPPDLAKHVSDLTDAYETYAKDAIAFYGEPLATTGKTAFNASMLALLIPPFSLANYAQIIENAIIAYWNSSSFSLIPPPPVMSSLISNNITAPIAGSIAPGLQSALNASTGNGALLATQMSTIVHTGTLTTTTTFIGPSITFPFPIITIPLQPIS